MTRKRFVKLMMANGYSRDESNYLALGVQMRDDTYAHEYIFMRNLWKRLGMGGTKCKS